MGEVVKLTTDYFGRIEPEDVLKCALERAAEFEEVIVIGRMKRENYYASSTSDSPTMLWMTEKLKQLLLSKDYDND